MFLHIHARTFSKSREILQEKSEIKDFKNERGIEISCGAENCGIVKQGTNHNMCYNAISRKYIHLCQIVFTNGKAFAI